MMLHPQGISKTLLLYPFVVELELRQPFAWRSHGRKKARVPHPSRLLRRVGCKLLAPPTFPKVEIQKELPQKFHPYRQKESVT
jgi:hypothetical protein